MIGQTPMQPMPSLILTGLLCALLIGCETTPQTTTTPAPSVPPRDYADIQADHANRVRDIDQYWSRAVVEIRWTDEQGNRRFEQGDGPLIVRPPHDLALAIGKLGNTHFWLGCDAERYWLFDLAGDERLAYVGQQANVRHARQQVLPMPIRPDQLIGLLDITPLPQTDEALVTRDGDDHLIVLPPEDQLGGLIRKIRIDHLHRVTEIELMNQRGQAVMLARLSSFEPMPIEGRPPGAYPHVAERIAITIGEGDATVTLFARSATQGKGRVRDQQFNFESLTKALRTDRVMDVDADQPPVNRN